LLHQVGDLFELLPIFMSLVLPKFCLASPHCVSFIVYCTTLSVAKDDTVLESS